MDTDVGGKPAVKEATTVHGGTTVTIVVDAEVDIVSL